MSDIYRGDLKGRCNRRSHVDSPQHDGADKIRLGMPNSPRHGASLAKTQSAKWAEIHRDYKKTSRVETNSGAQMHRVRKVLGVFVLPASVTDWNIRHSYVPVFLIDAKRIDPPAPTLVNAAPCSTKNMPVTPAPTKPELVTAHAEHAAGTGSADKDPSMGAAQFAAMRDQLAHGVQIVTAPQLFPTPRELAEHMVSLAGVQPGHRVLEPSAGTGMILGALGGKMFTHDGRGAVHAVEINRALAGRLEMDFPLTKVHCADFLVTGPDYFVPFDRIIMNPPFENGADIRHIMHARGMLRTGGRLVAICANGPRQRAALQPLVSEWHDLPSGTFKNAGTNVNTALLVINA